MLTKPGVAGLAAWAGPGAKRDMDSSDTNTRRTVADRRLRIENYTLAFQTSRTPSSDATISCFTRPSLASDRRAVSTSFWERSP